MSTISNSGVYEIDCMLAGPAFRWNAYTPYGSGITLTYSFPTSIPSYYQDGSISQFHAFNDYWKQLTRIVLTKYQSVADITFIEVDESVSSGGQIRFSFEDTERGGYAYYPKSPFENGWRRERVVIQASYVDRSDTRPDGQDREEDEAVCDGPDR